MSSFGIDKGYSIHKGLHLEKLSMSKELIAENIDATEISWIKHLGRKHYHNKKNHSQLNPSM